MAQIAKMVAQRLALGLLTLFVVSLIIFLAVELLPGDFTQAVLGQSATPETVAAFRKELGLDQPAYLRYFHWLGDIVQLDLGRSFANQRPITELLGPRIYNTLFLAAYAAVIAVPIALTFGILAALYRNSIFDRSINVAALTAISSPEFLAAYILILIFAVELGWLPAIARVNPDTTFFERLYILLLPAVTLTLVTMAHMMRMTRAAIINLMASPYIEMARLKGLRRGRIILRHALPNALAPIINVIAINLAYLIVGVVVVEVVFTYPGLGELLVDSVSKRDMPVVQISCLVFAVTYIALNLLADILSILSNPRLRHPR
ncbi:MAG: ABC transporter permease [Halofilum sp. (in: g-proteobacteria)]|nr:ABC transporter permease [Halofilum sp. (in: g-proteobacteria)]